MKAQILLFSLCCFSGVFAQRSSIFSVSDVKAGGAAWNSIREMENDKDAGKLLLSDQSFSGTRVDAGTQQKRAISAQSLSRVDDLPMHSGVASLAYDGQHRRLYFCTMFGGDIRYIQPGKDAGTYYQIGNVYDAIPRANNSPLSAQNQGPVITRMTMGDDGYVYGLSNDGETFFRISTTAKKPAIENIGKLVDDASNGAMSVHMSCSSWGGDMVAAATGDLYLFSMYQQVFRINPATRSATYLGKLQGLPGDFSINGAAVNEDGVLMLSSAAVTEKVALVADISNLTAEIKARPGWFNTSDLASSNVLFGNKEATFGVFANNPQSANLDVFPNPIVNSQMIINFKRGMEPGKYALDILDNAGSNKMQSSVNINGQAQRVTLRTERLASGLYLLRATHAQTKKIETVKVMVQ